MAECQVCGRDFKGETGLKTHIGMKHPELRENTCQYCGDDFKPPNTNLSAKFCCRSCWSESHRVTLECNWCGDEFSTPQSDQDYRSCCSFECANKHRAQLRSETVEAKCEWCGSTIETTPAVPRRFCDQECHGEWQSEYRIGENHPTFKGGYGRPPGWLSARREALQRAGNTCSECGVDGEEYKQENGYGLDVHHKTPVLEYDGDDPNKQENLEVLCRSCHLSIERSG